MIYAYNILTGYMAVRGTIFIHLPMFIAQLLLVNCPENLGEGFEELEFTLRSQWWLQLILHFFLGALQFAIIIQYFSSEPQLTIETILRPLQILGVIFETLNFALVASIAISLVTEFSVLTSDEYFTSINDL